MRRPFPADSRGGRCPGASASWPPAIASSRGPRASSRNFPAAAKWGAYADFRKMFEKEKLDAVMVETTTHARAWIVIQAMQAGKDVYIEKPMCLTIAEGRTMVKAARKYNRVTQVGTQQRSMPHQQLGQRPGEERRSGQDPDRDRAELRRPRALDQDPAKPMPDGRSSHWWDIWTNQAELRPYHGDLHHGWDRWWDYDGGGRCFGVTGWGTHSYDQINRALGTDDTGPVEILLEEPVKVTETGKFAPQDCGRRGSSPQTRTPARTITAWPSSRGPRAKVTMKFANGTELKLHLDGDRGPGLGAIFVGEKGKIEINRNKIASNPKELVDSPDNPGPNNRPETAYHIENWIECIKSRKRATPTSRSASGQRRSATW